MKEASDDGPIDSRLATLVHNISSPTSFRIEGVPLDIPADPIQKFVRRYGSSLIMTFQQVGAAENQTITLNFTLHPLTPEEAWKNMIQVGGNEALLVSEKRERLGYRFRILANGFSLQPLVYLHFVDMNGCISYYPTEMKDQFGIEVGRAHIFSELMANGGKDIASRHISVLADMQSYLGILIPIVKSGKEKMGAGPLAQAAFQETYKTLTGAQMRNARDPLRSTVGKTLVGEFDDIDLGQTYSREYRADELDSTLTLMMSLGKRIAPKEDAPTKPIPRRPVNPGEGEMKVVVVSKDADLDLGGL
jgi:hypothetical protein